MVLMKPLVSAPSGMRDVRRQFSALLRRDECHAAGGSAETFPSTLYRSMACSLWMLVLVGVQPDAAECRREGGWLAKSRIDPRLDSSVRRAYRQCGRSRRHAWPVPTVSSRLGIVMDDDVPDAACQRTRDSFEGGIGRRGKSVQRHADAVIRSASGHLGACSWISTAPKWRATGLRAGLTGAHHFGTFAWPRAGPPAGMAASSARRHSFVADAVFMKFIFPWQETRRCAP